MKTTRDLGGSLPDVTGMPVKIAHDEMPAAGVPLNEPVARTQFQLIRRRFLRHRLAVGALVILLILFLMALFAKQVARYPANPTPLPLLQAYHGPSAAHWFGTDDLGRDQATRILFAARISLTIGLAVAICSTLIGVLVGSLAGYFGGWVDQILMRITDLFLIVPGLAVIAMAEQGFENKKIPVIGHISSATLIIVILSFLFWMYIARVVRGLFLSIKEKEFVEAARASGASSARVMFRHIIPNIIGPIAVNTTLAVGAAIVLESTLSFLGFGVKLPQVSLGSMLSQSENSVGTHTSYLIYFPGLFLLLVVLCVNFVGDGLRDAFDPQSRHH